MGQDTITLDRDFLVEAVRQFREEAKYGFVTEAGRAWAEGNARAYERLLESLDQPAN